MMLEKGEVRAILGSRIIKIVENTDHRLGLRLDNGKCIWIFLAPQPGQSLAVVSSDTMPIDPPESLEEDHSRPLPLSA